MRVPDDVTLLWCDDNWGNIRRLPTPEERKRRAALGSIITSITWAARAITSGSIQTRSRKVWEQMNLALEYGADRIWVVNVGDLKPMEFPIEFFLSMAHSPKRWGKDNLEEFTRMWAAREFGAEHAVDIASMIDDYTRYNARRKPEQLEPTTFSLTNYGEADRVDREWRELSERVDKLATELPENERASFFELVQYPVDASATVAEMYIAAGRNALDARLGTGEGERRCSGDQGALRERCRAERCLQSQVAGWALEPHDGSDAHRLHVLAGASAECDAGGTEVQVPVAGSLSIATEQGSPLRQSLGTFDSVAQQTPTVELFNRGSTPVGYTVTTGTPWILVSRHGGQRCPGGLLRGAVDWKTAPAGHATGAVTVTPHGGAPMQIPLESLRLPGVTRESAQGFIESDGYIAIEAADTSSRTSDGATHWEELPGFGETHSAMTVFPVTAASNLNSAAGLKYHIYLSDTGTLRCTPFWPRH